MLSHLITVHPASDVAHTMLQDFELAAWQLTYLCLAPKRVCVDLHWSRSNPSTDLNVDTGTSISTSVRAHRDLHATRLTNNVETKNTWARDDPAILILLSACLCGECDVNTKVASFPDDSLSCGFGLVGGILLQFSRLF